MGYDAPNAVEDREATAGPSHEGEQTEAQAQAQTANTQDAQPEAGPSVPPSEAKPKNKSGAGAAWTSEEDEALIRAVEKYGTSNWALGRWSKALQRTLADAVSSP